MCEIIYGIMSSLPMATPLKTCISLPATINCLPMLKKGCDSQAPLPILWFSSCVLCSLKLFCGSCITYCLSQRVLVKGGAADNSVRKTVWQGILPCVCHAALQTLLFASGVRLGQNTSAPLCFPFKIRQLFHFFLNYVSMCVSECVFVYLSAVPTDPSELELQVIVSHLMWEPRRELGVSGRPESALNC